MVLFLKLIEGGINMKKYSFALIVFLFLSLSVFFALDSHTIIQDSIIVGEVTLVGDNTLRVKDDATGAERELWSTQAKLKDVNTGYRVEVKQKSEKVIKLKVIGVPKEAEPLVLDGETSLPVKR